jgi:hypothetical protein
MANENEIHQDLGTDLGHGGPRVSGPTEAAYLRRQQTGSTPPADAKPHIEQQKEQAAAKESARVAALSPTERRLEELNRFDNPDGVHSRDEAKQKAAMTELRKLLAADPEEQSALGEATLEDNRERYGLRVPGEHVLPKVYAEEYEQNFSGHEHDFFVAARQHGLDTGLVSELRDEGIRMAIRAQGAPVSEDQWAAFDAKFGRRLTKTQVTALKSWWKTSVERGGDAE